MTDEVCYAYTTAFIQHLQEHDLCHPGSIIGFAGDYRPSTPRILRATALAIAEAGYTPRHLGYIPTPCLACYGLHEAIPTIMVTGSHIPEDRNGIKFYRPDGEILKPDEDSMRRQQVAIPAASFDANGALTAEIAYQAPAPVTDAQDLYIQRYLDFFPTDCLKGKNVGLYGHSSVARELFYDIFTALGAEVTRLGFTDTFTPVDTEAIRPEDILLGKQWAEKHNFDSIISADGDGDRPLVSDENGHWLRGDIAGIITAEYLGADAVITPVSSNTAAEKSGLFTEVIRTRIGSPYVIAGMQQACTHHHTVVGYEANGGFLTATSIQGDSAPISPLPTRDATIVALCILLASIKKHATISGLCTQLPQRFTSSDRIKEFPTELSQKCLNRLNSGDFARDKTAIEAIFKEEFGPVSILDSTDGLRITFENSEVVHLRPSGNAPEFRCYNEADTEQRALEMNDTCMRVLKGWKTG
jgi:phosphomannomutase